MSVTLAHTMSVIALFGAGIVSGVFFAVAVSVIPTAMALPASNYVQIHKLLGRYYDPVMPIIVILALLADAVLSWMSGPSVWVRALFLCCAVLLLAVAVVSRACNVPINRQVHGVDPAALPADWSDPRPLWRNWHYLRTTCAILSLTANAIAVAWR